MARGDKPYRVYRGGRVKGRVPLQRRAQEAPRRDGRRPSPAAPTPTPVVAPTRRRRSWGRRIAIGLVLLLLVVLAWAVASYIALGRAVDDANQRLGPVPLDQQSGLVLNVPTTTLLLGTDHGPGAGREGAQRTDSIILMRTDPDRGRTSFLSIPRDLRVDVPGRGFSKINAAYQTGGADLTLRTVRGLLGGGVAIHHVVAVDFNDFEQLIDALGGVTIDVPEAIVSNRFDCPYSTQERCQRWPGWRFRAGEQTMSGRRALIYSRIRENRLNPAENDLTRGERQQAMLRAIGDEITSFSTLVRMPFLADDLVQPLATDLSASELVQLGWVNYRAGRTLRCRLGGTPTSIGGESALVPVEENRNVVLMFLGVAAPQPPPPQYGLFGPGCVTR